MHNRVNVLSFTRSPGLCRLEVCITIEVQKSNILAAYRSHPGLQQRFPDFRAGQLRGKGRVSGQLCAKLFRGLTRLWPALRLGH